MWWGPKFVQLYNDAYRPIPGAKHPVSMGQPASECWSEIWHIIGPMIEAPFRGEPATWSDDLELFILRRGFLEETHYKVAYSPVPDETAQPTGIGGVLATVAEITQQVYGERQLRRLRELGARAADADTPEDACATAAATLCANARDVPFALLYLLDETGQAARLAGAHGLRPGEDFAAPMVIELSGPASAKGWPLGKMVTGVRFVDPKTDKWTVMFTAPSFAVAIRMEGGAEGDRIVLRGHDDKGNPLRWSFNDILPDSFIWRGETSYDGGKTWRLEEEHHMRRRGQTSATAPH